jgi:predicted esterase
LDNAKKRAEMYKGAGATVTHELNPAAHGLIQSDLQAMQRWFAAI